MDRVNLIESSYNTVESTPELLLRAATSVPISHYMFGLLLTLLVFIYNFLEMHLFGDLFSGFRGQPVTLTFNPSSQLYRDVVSKCKILHGRFLSTPWLCSPHLQTVFVHFLGNSPAVKYRRQIFTTSDGGTIALDWVINADVKKPAIQMNNAVQDAADRNPILLIIPGLSSASDSSYIKHLAFKIAKHGWNVVVSNHRGIGGVAITSDCFYSGGWTEDARSVVDHLHRQYPEAPLFVVGTSIGANILVKYLGEDGINVPIVGAAAICSPWDLLICDRYMARRFVQRFYNKALTIGLKDYAYMHEAVLSRLSNWEGVKKSRWVREFDDCATRILGNFETVDTYYRRCSSVNFVGSVTVPLLCVSSLDDPVCSSEAIPWDECRLNNNVVLATTQHGGHLPFFEGITANSVWWVRAVDEFFRALQCSPQNNQKKEVQVPVSSVTSPLESSIDQAPYVHVSKDGLVTAVSDEVAEAVVKHQGNTDENKTEEESNKSGQEEQSAKMELNQVSEQDTVEIVGPVEKQLNELSRQNRKTLWLLAYIAIMSTWPVVGSALAVFFRKKIQKIFSRT
ncbi:hypothetical protein ACJIZ3_001076 [Penstemon smallii]|uniref:Serine aminopeptidase S33 domain-containing protein n=1 Tax=Penstemon smallii TaxID=265156 RepID=A0ABD3U5B7_9LAMI